MAQLNVPYLNQINDNACGAAVLAMVYQYYGRKNILQTKIFRQYCEKEPHGSGNLRITTDNLVRDAKGRGFDADRGRVNLENRSEVFSLLKKFILEKSPLVVVQQFTKEQAHLGHFRVVVGINEENQTILVHDPHSSLGGPSKVWALDKFIDFWRETGQNVTGGVYVWIKPKE